VTAVAAPARSEPAAAVHTAGTIEDRVDVLHMHAARHLPYCLKNNPKALVI
jgi:hypothetical protein